VLSTQPLLAVVKILVVSDTESACGVHSRNRTVLYMRPLLDSTHDVLPTVGTVCLQALVAELPAVLALWL
jgi:hypothetical protein